MIFVDSDLCHWMASLQKLYSVTIIYFFNVKFLNVNVSSKLHNRSFVDFLYLPTNYTIMKVVPHDIDLLFNVKDWKVNISETVRACTKCDDFKIPVILKKLFSKNANKFWALPVDLPPLVRHLLSSCSCLLNIICSYVLSLILLSSVWVHF